MPTVVAGPSRGVGTAVIDSLFAARVANIRMSGLPSWSESRRQKPRGESRRLGRRRNVQERTWTGLSKMPGAKTFRREDRDGRSSDVSWMRTIAPFVGFDGTLGKKLTYNPDDGKRFWFSTTQSERDVIPVLKIPAWAAAMTLFSLLREASSLSSVSTMGNDDLGIESLDLGGLVTESISIVHLAT